MCAEVFHALKKVVPASGVGDEGGYARISTAMRTRSGRLSPHRKRPPITSPARISRIAIDGAVSDWYCEDDGCYHLPKRGTVT